LRRKFIYDEDYYAENFRARGIEPKWTYNQLANKESRNSNEAKLNRVNLQKRVVQKERARK